MTAAGKFGAPYAPATALTWATCTGLNTAGRPDRFASPNEGTPGAAHQRCRHLRAVSLADAQRGRDPRVRLPGGARQDDAGAQGQPLLGPPGMDQPVQGPALGIGQHDRVRAGRRHRQTPD